MTTRGPDGYVATDAGDDHPLELTAALPRSMRRRPRVLIFLPALIALGLIAALLAIAVHSLQQRPAGDEPDSGATVTQVIAAARKARIEAPFAPSTLRPLSADEARAFNARRAASGPVASAEAFLLRSGDANDYARSLQCMTMAVYYEAGSESDDGERAVAQVVLNRLRHPAYPKTVCGVVLDGAQRRTGCQFTFACDGSLARAPSVPGWARATRIAAAALGGGVYQPVGWATHYHANYVVPYWAASLIKVASIGAHVFYRWNGLAGTAAAFQGRYSGHEPAVSSVLAPGAAPSPVPAEANDVAVATQDRPILSGVAPSAAETSTVVTLDERRILARPATDERADR
ncbi:cell wall hydrolase [Sphingomonas citricola]|uniref:cell wall hydrolase n=1 Tax=Sphingomonas citricola TaxID=2862498 RepID=UPI0027E3F218|nr:cell wall hydrolase [Sphingomonas citricola]